MKNLKIGTCLCLILVLTSCNLANLHNVKNDYRWKNKKLDQPLHYNYVFNPKIIKNFDDDSWFLTDYFKDTLVVKEIKVLLEKKLKKRNFISDEKSNNSIVIDSLIFKETIEMVNVYNPDKNENLGDHEKYDVNIIIKGQLNISVEVFKIERNYAFKSTPREGYVFKDMIAYDNSMVNLDKVMNNLLNAFSYECYKIADRKNKN